MDWQPIETAPKVTNQAVLVTRSPYTGKPPIACVLWSRGPNKCTLTWRIKNHTAKKLRWDPTHWMPLPDPPK